MYSTLSVDVLLQMRPSHASITNLQVGCASLGLHKFSSRLQGGKVNNINTVVRRLVSYAFGRRRAKTELQVGSLCASFVIIDFSLQHHGKQQTRLRYRVDPRVALTTRAMQKMKL